MKECTDLRVNRLSGYSGWFTSLKKVFTAREIERERERARGRGRGRDRERERESERERERCKQKGKWETEREKTVKKHDQHPRKSRSS